MSITAKFDADLDSIEKSAKKLLKKGLRPKTFAHSNNSKKTPFFCYFFVDNFIT
jgi:hypothetical protein